MFAMHYSNQTIQSGLISLTNVTLSKTLRLEYLYVDMKEGSDDLRMAAKLVVGRTKVPSVKDFQIDADITYTAASSSWRIKSSITKQVNVVFLPGVVVDIHVNVQAILALDKSANWHLQMFELRGYGDLVLSNNADSHLGVSAIISIADDFSRYNFTIQVIADNMSDEFRRVMETRIKSGSVAFKRIIEQIIIREFTLQLTDGGLPTEVVDIHGVVYISSADEWYRLFKVLFPDSDCNGSVGCEFPFNVNIYNASYEDIDDTSSDSRRFLATKDSERPYVLEIHKEAKNLKWWGATFDAKFDLIANCSTEAFFSARGELVYKPSKTDRVTIAMQMSYLPSIGQWRYLGTVDLQNSKYANPLSWLKLKTLTLEGIYQASQLDLHYSSTAEVTFLPGTDITVDIYARNFLEAYIVEVDLLLEDPTDFAAMLRKSLQRQGNAKNGLLDAMLDLVQDQECSHVHVLYSSNNGTTMAAKDGKVYGDVILIDASTIVKQNVTQDSLRLEKVLSNLGAVKSRDSKSGALRATVQFNRKTFAWEYKAFIYNLRMFSSKVNFRDCELSVSSTSDLLLTAKLFVDLQKNPSPLEFNAYASLNSTSESFVFTGSMVGEWIQPFGLPFLAVKDVSVHVHIVKAELIALRIKASATFLSKTCSGSDFDVSFDIDTHDEFHEYTVFMRSVSERGDFACAVAGVNSGGRSKDLTVVLASSKVFIEPLRIEVKPGLTARYSSFINPGTDLHNSLGRPTNNHRFEAFMYASPNNDEVSVRLNASDVQLFSNRAGTRSVLLKYLYASLDYQRSDVAVSQLWIVTAIASFNFPSVALNVNISVSIPL
jgi:hypothetical protein